jgi:hypothetical protein
MKLGPYTRVYFDFTDWWIGYYRGENHHYICPLPTVVIRVMRKHERSFVHFLRKAAK